jgi:hypothetical protein
MGALACASRAPLAQASDDHEFYFTRAIYSGLSDLDDWGPRWAMDFPDAEQHFVVALQRLTSVDAYNFENAIEIGADALSEYPFVYAVEVGAITLTEDERDSLRRYLLAGGLLVVDDFWGTWAWDHLSAEMKRLFPDQTLRDVPLDHPIFHAFYDIQSLLQVPNIGLAGTGRTHEFDGYVAHAKGIFDEAGRLMVLVNWNTDLGDAWEWADDPRYPLRYSTYAFEMGVNIIIYSLLY